VEALKPDTVRLIFAIALTVFATAVRAAPSDQPIALDTPTGQIAGSLMMPPAKGVMPVALIIAGSGPTDRNGNSRLVTGANNSLLMLAQALADAGFATVRYDKRGLGASTPAGLPQADLRFEMYVDDASGWIAKLKRDARFSSVIVIGHSEGSLIGMLAAKQAKADAFVSVAGIARGAGQVLRTQLAGKLTPELAARNEAFLTALERGDTSVAAPIGLATIYPESVKAYMASWFRYVGAERIATLEVPVLIVQGTTDIQVSVREAEGLKAALPRAQLAVIPEMNHVLKIVPTGSATPLASYSDPALPLAPGLISALVDFMKRIPPK
jgi:pimeloyl-ACP methyl ester carboxylesterase